MREEEKKAIENIEKWLNKEESYCTDEDIKTVLNLIETQKAEIENLKWKNNIYVKSIKSHKAELEKKNKQIDLMAEQLTSPINDKKWVIEYYTKLAEEERQMAINFNEEEVILVFNGVQIRICEELAVDMAKQILDYFEKNVPEED